MGKSVMKHGRYLFFSFLLLLGGCRPGEQPSHSPLWEFKTVYPVSFLQDLDSLTIGASAINRYLLIAKKSGEVTNEIPVVGSAIAGMVWEDPCLYYGSSERYFRCYDVRQKALRWETETSLEIEALPVVDETTVYGGCRDHYFYALDKHSGIIRWKFKTASPIYARPVLYGSLVLIGSWDTHLYALHRQTGQEIWRFTAQAGVDQLPVIAHQILWLPNYDYHIYGIDLHSGRTLFAFAADNAFEFGGAVWNDTVLFSGIDRKLYVVDAATEQLSVGGDSPIAISTTPLVIGDGLYTGQYDGALYCWDLPGMSKTLLHRFRDRVTGLLSDGHYLWATSWDRRIAAFKLEADRVGRHPVSAER